MWLRNGFHLVSEASAYSLRGFLLDADLFEGRILAAKSRRKSNPEDCARQLYQARALYGGDFLPLDVSDWVTRRRTRLQVSALDAYVFLASWEIQRYDYTRAQELAEQALSVDSLREDAVRLELEALVGLGRRSEALRYFQQFIDLLRNELTCAPDPVTTAAADRLGLV